MPLRVNPGYQKQLISHLLTEMAAREEREQMGANLFHSDICDWSERNFYIPNTGDPIKLPLHQKAVLRLFFTRGENKHFPYQTIVYSTVKKSGKSTIAGAVGRWFAETQARYGEIYTIGNDQEQAKERSYKEIARSLELTPGYNREKDMLPGRWKVNKLSMRCYMTGGMVKAVAVDAAGEAGGQPALTIWTELWGFEDMAAKRFWDEMTPIPTVPDSLRMVETYAGYDGESELLKGLYDKGTEGHQMTAGELAAIACRPDIPGESFEDYVWSWRESHGDPDTLIPVWVHPQAGLAIYWDSGMIARRMPWQHMFEPVDEELAEKRKEFISLYPNDNLCAICWRPETEHDIGVTADQYYAGQEATLPPQAYHRLHLNEWVGAESSFVPMEAWDQCGKIHPIKPLTDGERTKIIIAADAAVTGDCFGAVAVQRCPHDSNCVDIRALKKWDPKESGGVIQLEEPEAFLREACKRNNVVQICYDPYQMENMAQRLRKEGIAWVEPFTQVGDRLKADSALYDMIIGRQIHFWHSEECYGDYRCSCMMKDLREHISNANAKMQVNEDSKLRIVKKVSGKKIDLAVALSMAAARCMYLRVEEKVRD
jgi:hypothetical protein